MWFCQQVTKKWSFDRGNSQPVNKKRWNGRFSAKKLFIYLSPTSSRGDLSGRPHSLSPRRRDHDNIFPSTGGKRAIRSPQTPSSINPAERIRLHAGWRLFCHHLYLQTAAAVWQNCCRQDAVVFIGAVGLCGMVENGRYPPQYLPRCLCGHA